LDAAEMGTFEWDLPASTFQYSDRLARMFGYTDVSGLDHDSFECRIHPQDQALRIEAHNSAFRTGNLHYEARVLWPDQSVHWVQINGKVIYDEAGNPFRMYGTSRLVDDIKQQEDVLKQLVAERTASLQHQNDLLKHSEERYHKMVQEVQEYAIILMDRQGIIQNWNKGAQAIKQYTESEAVGRHFSMFYLPDDVAANLPGKLMQQAVDHGRAVHEGWRRRKDGTRFWGSITLTALHDDNNVVTGFSKVTRDLTERKAAEDQLKAFTEELQHRNEALRKSEERYHKMISEVQDYAIILLNENGDIENWNIGAEKIKGYTAAEIVGKNFEVFYTAADRERRLPRQLLNEAVMNGKAIHEGWRLRKDGSRFWGSIVITVLHGTDGRIMGFSKVTRDLTERKLAEEKNAAYLIRLEAQNKELEQFAYVASHDLQEPLRKIQVFTGVIAKSLPDDELARQYLAKVNASANRMSQLIKSVLNYSRLSRDAEPLMITDFDAILANVLSDYELLIQEKNAQIITQPLPAIPAVPLQINQLFSNLIGNALKFTNKAPVIKISSRTLSKDEIVNAPAHLPEGQYLELVFSDNGIGFDQQYQQLIFGMFQRLHAKHEFSGTGIGLALCKRIMENHQGFITATGEANNGASFYVYFPLQN
jgi:PAS domain S-box-containing protein